MPLYFVINFYTVSLADADAGFQHLHHVIL